MTLSLQNKCLLFIFLFFFFFSSLRHRGRLNLKFLFMTIHFFPFPPILRKRKIPSAARKRKKKKKKDAFELFFFFFFLFKERLREEFKEPVTKSSIPWVEGMISTELSSALRDTYRSIAKWIQDCLRSNPFLKVKVDLQRQDIERRI